MQVGLSVVNPVLICVPRQMFFTSLEQPVLAEIRGYCWEPDGTHLTVGFPQEYTPATCLDFAPEFYHELINRLSDLVKRFGSSLCVPLVLFDRALSQPVLSDLGILVAAGVHINVSGMVLYPGGDSVRHRPHLVSSDTSDRDWLPMTKATRPLTGGFMCCCWLQFVMRGRGLWLLQSVCEHAASWRLSHGGWVICI